MTTLPQLVRLMPTGATKSLSCEVNESEDRLFSIALPNDEHLLAWKISRRSSCASPKVRACFAPLSMSPSDSAKGIVEELIVPAAQGLQPQVADGMSRSAGSPQAVPLHVRAVMSAREPPWSMAYSSRRSPAVRTLLGPEAQFWLDWLNSKSISVVPLGSDTRLHARLRNPGCPPVPASR